MIDLLIPCLVLVFIILAKINLLNIIVKNYQIIKLKPHLHNWQAWDLWYFLRLCHGIHMIFDDHASTYCLQAADLYQSNLNWDLFNQDLAQYKCVIVLDLLDIPDYYTVNQVQVPRDYSKIDKIDHNNVVVLTNNAYLLKFDHAKVIFYDLLHARSKLYYTSNLDRSQYIDGYKPWYYQKNADYHRPTVPMEMMMNQVNLAGVSHRRSKKFLFAGRLSRPERIEIHNKLLKFNNQGWISFINSRLPEEQEEEHKIPNYKPLAETYYTDSYINVYGETNVYNEVWHRTEKTIEPVIRYQMILPFASAGYVDYLKTLGINVPQELVQYPWDHIRNYNQRLTEYLKNLDWVLNYTIEDLAEIYHANHRLLIDNHNNFFDQPYCQNIWDLFDYI